MRRLALVLLAGCPPPRPPIANCVPLATSCQDGVPAVCSPEQRWHSTGRRCADLALVCCRAESPYGPPVHACVPAERCLP